MHDTTTIHDPRVVEAALRHLALDEADGRARLLDEVANRLTYREMCLEAIRALAHVIRDLNRLRESHHAALDAGRRLRDENRQLRAQLRADGRVA